VKLILNLTILLAIPLCVRAQSLTDAKKQIDINPNSSFEDSLNSKDREIWNRGPIDDKRYYVGGTVGTIFGFGLGHLMQDRYSDKGLLFTTGELGSILGGILAPAILCGSTPSSTRDNCASNFSTAGLVSFSAFKIWEIYDLWRTPIVDKERYQLLKKKFKDSGQIDFGASEVNGSNNMNASIKFEF
jgi:hypothetical protein